MLTDGRLPQPGKPEVLAGDLCRVDAFHVDTINFTVVGHLQPGIGALTLPTCCRRHEAWEPLFEQEDMLRCMDSARKAARMRVSVFIDSGLMAEEDRENVKALDESAGRRSRFTKARHLHPMSRTLPDASVAATLVLMLMLIGITLAATQMPAPAASKRARDISACCARKWRSHTRGWYAVHFICYGTFAGNDAAGDCWIRAATCTCSKW